MGSIPEYALHVAVPNTAAVERIVRPFVDDAGSAGFQSPFAIKDGWEYLVVDVHSRRPEPSCLSGMCDHGGYGLTCIDDFADRQWTDGRVPPAGEF